MQVDLEIFSPRWGHDDTYRVSLEQDELHISLGPRGAKATYRVNLGPEWTGESLIQILRNDMIYAPWNIQECIEYAWLQWRNGELSDEQVEHELKLLAEWLNTVTRSKPRSNFWSGYF